MTISASRSRPGQHSLSARGHHYTGRSDGSDYFAADVESWTLAWSELNDIPQVDEEWQLLGRLHPPPQMRCEYEDA